MKRWTVKRLPEYEETVVLGKKRLLKALKKSWHPVGWRETTGAAKGSEDARKEVSTRPNYRVPRTRITYAAWEGRKAPL
ncbi:MAG: hypothetical protein UZ03_NOB001000317 [Nitrospira sp. OLB3]|nr:MAG: hypothetical protein UZ03_NOB001000317 [Nitrospira sp. OLB3]